MVLDIRPVRRSIVSEDDGIFLFKRAKVYFKKLQGYIMYQTGP